MSTITKERIELFIKNPLENGLTRSEQMEVARIALASLEAKPIGAFHIADQRVDGTSDYIKDGEWPIDDGVIEVYAAPPAPVSVPYLLEQFAEFMAAESIKSGDYPDGWQCKASNAAHEYAQNIRAAMLQGAENAESRCSIQTAPVLDSLPKNAESRCSNAPVIPDGWVACSERMPETMVSVLVTGTWFHHAVAFWDGLSWCDLDFEPPVTHWMPLPAAPQQEVK
ncbi:DUF551 domain-containing protein [Escherichia coli]|nr:DUF551 domain-containing protein [Escherichia coli]EJU2325908.1 DUF551 domain-containing protein [Escherichia coli]